MFWGCVLFWPAQRSMGLSCKDGHTRLLIPLVPLSPFTLTIAMGLMLRATSWERDWISHFQTFLMSLARSSGHQVANFNSDDGSEFAINPTTGALTAISGSPFAAGALSRSLAVARPQ